MQAVFAALLVSFVQCQQGILPVLRSGSVQFYTAPRRLALSHLRKWVCTKAMLFCLWAIRRMCRSFDGKSVELGWWRGWTAFIWPNRLFWTPVNHLTNSIQLTCEWNESFWLIYLWFPLGYYLRYWIHLRRFWTGSLLSECCPSMIITQWGVNLWLQLLFRFQ